MVNSGKSLSFAMLISKYANISFFPPVGLFLIHIIDQCGVLLLTEECSLLIVIVKQVSEDEEINARKAQAFVFLEGKPCCVSHLQSNLQIY